MPRGVFRTQNMKDRAFSHSVGDIYSIGNKRLASIVQCREFSCQTYLLNTFVERK